MKNKKKANSMEIKQDSREESLTRRKAIKRIAAILAGATVGAKVLEQAPRDLYAYVDYVLPYVDSVPVPKYSDYVRYTSFYSSHRVYHSIYVPPPYSSTRR